jgi:hypothetical protein
MVVFVRGGSRAGCCSRLCLARLGQVLCIASCAKGPLSEAPGKPEMQWALL